MRGCLAVRLTEPHAHERAKAEEARGCPAYCTAIGRAESAASEAAIPDGRGGFELVFNTFTISYWQDARPPVPRRHTVVGADKRHTRRCDRHTGRRTTIRKHIECAPEAAGEDGSRWRPE